jgi:hypothetical protein
MVQKQKQQQKQLDHHPEKLLWDRVKLSGQELPTTMPIY